MAEQRARQTRPAAARRGGTRTGKVKGAEDAAVRAARGLSKLIGHRSDGCSGVAPADDGWRVCVDVVEVPRIPDTTSLLATYEVDLDGDGTLLGYRRLRRYRRGAADM